MSLTIKQNLFIKEYLRVLNATEAAFNIYNCKNKAVAAQIGYENLRKPEIKRRINHYFEANDLGLEDTINGLVSIIRAKTTKVSSSSKVEAISLYFKLIGAL